MLNNNNHDIWKNRTQRKKKISPRKSSWELILNIKLLQPKVPSEGRVQCGGRRNSGREQFCSLHWRWSGQTLGFFSSLNRGHGISFPQSRKSFDLGNKREIYSISHLPSMLAKLQEFQQHTGFLKVKVMWNADWTELRSGKLGSTITPLSI